MACLAVKSVGIFFLLLLTVQTNAQDEFRSPCPRRFVYDSKNNEPDKWYGIVTLLSDVDLPDIRLQLIFDRPALQLANAFGEAVTTNNKEYLIKKRNYNLKANQPEKVNFFIKYNPDEPPPKLLWIRLNDKTVCPEEAVGQEALELHVSAMLGEGGPQPQALAPGVTSSAASGDGKETCGTVRLAARPLLTNGQDTTAGEWPWHAALYRIKAINLQYICGGSLITPHIVLTAAHCVTKPKTGVPISADLFSVYLGKYNLYRLGPRIQYRAVRQVVPHPEYNATYLSNDLALVHLESPVDLTDYVRTVCLWESEVGLASIIDKLGTVIGWGLDQTGKVTENLKQARMPVVSTDTCIFSNRDFYSRFLSDKTFCAGFRNGTSACTGDSGGGMVFPKAGSGRSAVWQLRGVVSLSVAPQNEGEVCDGSNYIVFTDVAKHLQWIRTAMSSS